MNEVKPIVAEHAVAALSLDELFKRALSLQSQAIEPLKDAYLEYTDSYRSIIDYIVCLIVSSRLEIRGLILNLRCNSAVVPRSGEKHVALTHTRDVAWFAVALDTTKCMTIKEFIQVSKEVM